MVRTGHMVYIRYQPHGLHILSAFMPWFRIAFLEKKLYIYTVKYILIHINLGFIYTLLLTYIKISFFYTY